MVTPPDSRPFVMTLQASKKEEKHPFDFLNELELVLAPYDGTWVAIDEQVA
jgi:hypothetical protein